MMVRYDYINEPYSQARDLAMAATHMADQLQESENGTRATVYALAAIANGLAALTAVCVEKEWPANAQGVRPEPDPDPV